MIEYPRIKMLCYNRKKFNKLLKKDKKNTIQVKFILKNNIDVITINISNIVISLGLELHTIIKLNG